MKGLYDSKKIRFLSTKLPFGEKKEKFQMKKKREKEQISTTLLDYQLKQKVQKITIAYFRYSPASESSSNWFPQYVFIFPLNTPGHAHHYLLWTSLVNRELRHVCIVLACCSCWPEWSTHYFDHLKMKAVFTANCAGMIWKLNKPKDMFYLFFITYTFNRTHRTPFSHSPKYECV